MPYAQRGIPQKLFPKSYGATDPCLQQHMGHEFTCATLGLGRPIASPAMSDPMAAPAEGRI
jgi:hypothetical protein